MTKGMLVHPRYCPTSVCTRDMVKWEELRKWNYDLERTRAFAKGARYFLVGGDGGVPASLHLLIAQSDKVSPG